MIQGLALLVLLQINRHQLVPVIGAIGLQFQQVAQQLFALGIGTRTVIKRQRLPHLHRGQGQPFFLHAVQGRDHGDILAHLIVGLGQQQVIRYLGHQVDTQGALQGFRRRR